MTTTQELIDGLRSDDSTHVHKWRWYAADRLAEQEAEIERLHAALSEIKLLVDKQAMDSSLWFVAQYASEAYLQQELRRLHGLIEARAALAEDKK